MSKRYIFVVLLLAAVAIPAFGATSAWAVGTDPFATNDTPSNANSFNPAGDIKITRIAKGTYQIRFEKLGPLSAGGNVQVTPVNTISTFCSVTSFVKTGKDILVSIRCYDLKGALVDARYSVLFTTK